MSFFEKKIRLQIEGIMPERALLRLKRGGIPLYNVKKTQKNHILLTVNAKDEEKVFAFYPNVCYNSTDKTSPYVAKKIGAVGINRWIRFVKNRVGLILGCLLSLILVLFLNTFTFGVQFVGSNVYGREGKIALEKAGIKPFTPYRKGKEDIVVSTLLSLDGVEYCSVKKQGLYVRLEMRFSPFSAVKVDKESLYASRSGILRSISVLKGTPHKKAGEEITAGELLVENAFYTQEGEQVCVEVIARAVIECVFDEEIEAESEEQAFAKGYLSLNLAQTDEIVSREVVEKAERLYQVKIGYIVIERINL